MLCSERPTTTCRRCTLGQGEDEGEEEEGQRVESGWCGWVADRRGRNDPAAGGQQAGAG